MNKLFGMAMVFAVTFLGLLPGLAANEASAAINQRITFSGNSADAYWSTCWDGPVAGEACTDTWVFAADQATREKGNKSANAYTVLYFSQSTYTLDEDWNYLTYSWRSGVDENAQFSSTKKLDSAAASGNVLVEECTVVDFNTWEVDCTYPGVESVNVSWTGQGPLRQNAYSSSSRSKEVKYTSKSKYSYREAMATTNLGSGALGSSNYADISKSSDTSVTICRDLRYC